MAFRSRMGAVALLVALAACGGGGGDDDAAPVDTTANAVDAAVDTAATASSATGVEAAYQARDFAFEGPAQLPAGARALRMANSGSIVHHLQLVRLEDGHTAADLQAALTGKGPAPHFPEWAVPVGGVNAVDPGGEAQATAVLPAGRYAAVCMIPIPDGVPHAAKGMVMQIDVAGEQDGSAALPAAVATADLREYAIALSGTIPAGTRTVRVTNSGSEAHEVQVFRMQPGKRLADLLAWSGGGFEGPPPAAAVGGVPAIAPGDEAAFTMDFEPGVYSVVCFVPAPDGKKVHLELGMASEFEVT